MVLGNVNIYFCWSLLGQAVRLNQNNKLKNAKIQPPLHSIRWFETQLTCAFYTTVRQKNSKYVNKVYLICSREMSRVSSVVLTKQTNWLFCQRLPSRGNWKSSLTCHRGGSLHRRSRRNRAGSHWCHLWSNPPRSPHTADRCSPSHMNTDRCSCHSHRDVKSPQTHCCSYKGSLSEGWLGCDKKKERQKKCK